MALSTTRWLGLGGAMLLGYLGRAPTHEGWYLPGVIREAMAKRFHSLMAAVAATTAAICSGVSTEAQRQWWRRPTQRPWRC